MIEPVRKSIDTQAGAVSCLEWAAKDAEKLLFVHATGFNAQTYRTLLSPLANELHIAACDLRGHGFSTLSAQPGQARGWTIFRDDLLTLAEEISSHPIILAGHSLGATVSFMAAARSPAHVRSLILIEPVFLMPPAPGTRGSSNSLAEMAAQRRSVFASYASALDYYRNRGVFARWPDPVLADYLTGGLTDNGDGMLRLSCAPEWEAEIFREVPFGIAAIADDVKCPITILRGTVASTAIDDQIALILRAKPDTKVITIEGANHFLPMEQADRCRQEILHAGAGT